MPRSSSDLVSLDAHVFVSLDAFIRHKQIYIFVHVYSGRLSLWLSLCLCLVRAFACCFVLLLCLCFCCLALLCLLFRFYSALLCFLLFFVFSFEAPSVSCFFLHLPVRPPYASLVAFTFHTFKNMAGPNLELFKFSLYLFFPLAIMIHYGDPQWYHDNVLPVRDKFWPDESTLYVSL